MRKGEVALNSVFEKCRRVRKEGVIVFKELRRSLCLVQFLATAINGCITRKHPEERKPNVQLVRDLRNSGCCKERSDGIAIATLYVNRVQS